MSWLTDFVRPKLRALVTNNDVPDNLWTKCTSCEQLLFQRDLAKDLFVCKHCGKHMRLSAKDRLDMIFDNQQYSRIAIPEVKADPLKFRDSKKYPDRLKAARNSTGEEEAIIVASGEIGKITSVVAVLDFSFMGGSMGMAVGEGLVEAANQAVALHAPLIVFPASGGARMQEGILSLMQMPRSTFARLAVKKAGLPYITVLTDPTMGGVAASFAMLGDVSLAEPDAMIGFAGPRVIAANVRENLPPGFQRAEYLKEHGMIDRIVPRSKLRAELMNILQLLVVKTLKN